VIGDGISKTRWFQQCWWRVSEDLKLSPARGGALMLGMTLVPAVHLISGWSTDLCDQFFKKMRFVVRGFWMDFFFFLKCGSGRIELLVKALEL
jgi:hypothetical protein